MPGTGFVNWQDYARLNKPQAQQDLEGALGGIDQQGQAATDTLARLQEQFAQGAQEGGGYGGKGISVDKWGHEVPAGFVSDAQGHLTAQDQSYAGPQGLDAGALGQLRSQAGSVADTAQSLGSQGGVQALLESKYGQQGNYGGGLSRFDAALAGSNSGDRLSQLQGRYSGLNELVNGAANSARGQASQQAAYATRANAARQAEASRYNTAHPPPVPGQTPTQPTPGYPTEPTANTPGQNTNPWHEGGQRLDTTGTGGGHGVGGPSGGRPGIDVDAMDPASHLSNPGAHPFTAPPTTTHPIGTRPLTAGTDTLDRAQRRRGRPGQVFY